MKPSFWIQSVAAMAGYFAARLTTPLLIDQFDHRLAFEVFEAAFFFVVWVGVLWLLGRTSKLG